MGFDVRIAPGIRISASSRGIRAGIGPRAARVHVGSGRTGFSTGSGPFTYYTSGSRRRSSTGSSQRSSVAAYESQLLEADRIGEIEVLREVETAIVSLHLQEFSSAVRPIAPQPAAPDIHVLTKNFLKEELSGVGILKFAQKKVAKSRASERAIRQAAALSLEWEQERRQLQASFDDWWTRLLSNEEGVVLSALEAAFEDNESPAAPIDCRNDQATVVVLFCSLDAMPEKKPATTAKGRPTLKRRNKTELSDLYARSLASTVLVTVKETLAVAPRLKALSVIVLRKDLKAAEAEQYVAAIYAGTFTRPRIEEWDWHHVDPLEELMITPNALFTRRGATAQVSPLNLTNEPQLAEVVTKLKNALLGQPGATSPV